jgi:multiple sugar transport system substrate-binding protein
MDGIPDRRDGAGPVEPGAVLRAAAVDFEEITMRLGRDDQLRSHRASLGLKR